MTNKSRNRLGTSMLGVVTLSVILCGVSIAQTKGAQTLDTSAVNTAQRIDFSIVQAESAVSGVTLRAKASSGLPVKFTSTSTTVCSVSGSTIDLHDEGICIVQASQEGNADYASASMVTQSFTVKSAGTCCGPFNTLQGSIVSAPVAAPPSYTLSPDCPFPTIASVSPDVWFAGATYEVVMKGTGFTSRTQATRSCPTTYVTAKADSGSALLFNVTVVNSTTITGTVTTGDSNAESPANVIIWSYAPPEDAPGPVLPMAPKK